MCSSGLPRWIGIFSGFPQLHYVITVNSKSEIHPFYSHIQKIIQQQLVSLIVIEFKHCRE